MTFSFVYFGIYIFILLSVSATIFFYLFALSTTMNERIFMRHLKLKFILLNDKKGEDSSKKKKHAKRFDLLSNFSSKDHSHTI